MTFLGPTKESCAWRVKSAHHPSPDHGEVCMNAMFPPTDPPTPEPIVISVKEAARMLGNVSVRHVYDLIHKAGLPSVRVGIRKMGTPMTGLREWLQERAASSIMKVATGLGAKERTTCHTGGKIQRSGGRPTLTQAARELDDLLGLSIERRQKPSR